MKRLTILLELRAVKDELPDAEQTVQLFNRRWNDDTGTWLGWWDGEEWFDMSAMRLTGREKPTHWCPLPTLADATTGESLEAALARDNAQMTIESECIPCDDDRRWRTKRESDSLRRALRYLDERGLLEWNGDRTTFRMLAKGGAR